MSHQFEAAGNFAEWPKNVPGRPTQAAVFGMRVTSKGVESEILWTGKFPELDSAMYWAAKKEVHAVRKGGWQAASRVLWQHDLTPEEAVEASRKQMEPQFRRAAGSIEAGGEPTLGDGPLKEVDPSEAQGHHFEVEGPDGEDVVVPFFVPLEPEDDLER